MKKIIALLSTSLIATTSFAAMDATDWTIYTNQNAQGTEGFSFQDDGTLAANLGSGIQFAAENKVIDNPTSFIFDLECTDVFTTGSYIYLGCGDIVKQSGATFEIKGEGGYPGVVSVYSSLNKFAMPIFGFDLNLSSVNSLSLSFVLGDDCQVSLTANGTKFVTETFDKITLPDDSKLWLSAMILEVDESDSFVITNFSNVIPEASTYAAIFGALAFGFVIYHRRK